MKKKLSQLHFYILPLKPTKVQPRCIHMSKSMCGIEEFFPPGVLQNKQPLPEQVESGKYIFAYSTSVAK